MTLNDWHELLKTGKACCYLFPVGVTNESGFQEFEIGYMTLENHKMKEKFKMGLCDMVHLNNTIKDKTFSPSIDMTIDGYIRLTRIRAKWDDEENTFNDMWLETL